MGNGDTEDGEDQDRIRARAGLAYIRKLERHGRWL